MRRRFGSCSRCKTPIPRESGEDFKHWVVDYFLGYPVNIKCPDCLSPEECAESVIRESTGIYTFEGGRVVQHPKPMSDD